MQGMIDKRTRTTTMNGNKNEHPRPLPPPLLAPPYYPRKNCGDGGERSDTAAATASRDNDKTKRKTKRHDDDKAKKQSKQKAKQKTKKENKEKRQTTYTTYHDEAGPTSCRAGMTRLGATTAVARNLLQD